MPDLYCSACKRTTAHKSIMCRNEVVPDSSIGQFFNSIGQIFRGNHYCEMKAQLFCRECNCQHIKLESNMSGSKINTTTQVSLN